TSTPARSISPAAWRMPTPRGTVKSTASACSASGRCAYHHPAPATSAAARSRNSTRRRKRRFIGNRNAQKIPAGAMGDRAAEGAYNTSSHQPRARTPIMTVWTEHLATLGATLGDASLHFADAASEARAATEKTIAVPLLHLGTIRSVGPDSAVFLHNLVSNEVKKLEADAAEWNSFNSPKGRMIASFLMWPEAEGHALALSADILPAFLKKFSMYVLRSKVKLS